MRIALISDTHGLIPEDVFPYLEECDEVWHAGDIGKVEMFDQLKDQYPLIEVWGNIDNAEIRNQSNEWVLIEREGIKALIIHIGGYPGRYSRKAQELILDHQPDLFISGHSHILKIMRDPHSKMLHMNPGACGYKGFHHFRTMIRFSITDGKIHDVQAIEIGKRGMTN